jgi:putative ABC transport system permease protein
MILMVAIGVGVFLGFHMEWYSLDRDTSALFESTNYADFRLYKEQGFSEEDIASVQDIPGVTEATRVLSVNVGVEDTEKSLALFCPEKYTVSTMYITSGEDYDENADGFWLSDQFAEANHIQIGDTLTLTYRNLDLSGEVLGLAKSGEFMICVADENQLMPDYNSYGFVYASPKKIMKELGVDFYPQINLTSELEKEELEEAVSEALDRTTLVLSKKEHTPYAGARSEIQEGETMGSILPVLFLLIGILTMVTTMHRITANEKTQIGTLKALGFQDRKILWHYTSYGLVIGLFGSALGILLGFGIAYMVVSPHGMESTYMDLPDWSLYIPKFCWAVILAVVAFLTLIGYLSVKQMLRGTAAEALRPYTPKKVKPLAIEKTKLWDRWSFATRWNLRDIFRHRSRSLMTLIGVLGCMLLLVGGLGMRDTMQGYLGMIDDSLHYETRVNLAESAENDQAQQLAKDLEGDYLASSSVCYDGKAVTLDIYHVTQDKIRLSDAANRPVTLGDDGVYLCIRLSDGIKVGDTIEFSPYGSEETYEVQVAGVIRSVLTESITMTKTYADQVGIPYHISAVFTDEKPADIPSADYISGTQTKQNLMDSYDSFMEIMYVMVIVFVLAAVILGIVVLYNLGIMSYMERYRELATLKVVGFRDGRIGEILITQNIWLTIVGVVIGLPLGVGVLQWIITALASEYELKMTLGPITYLVSILLTFGVSLAVGLLVSRKNKKIDMVEALKGTE